MIPIKIVHRQHIDHGIRISIFAMVMAATPMERGLMIQLMYVQLVYFDKKITLSSVSYAFQVGGISIANQSFAVISSANGMNKSAFDGILGMGYQKIANGGENPVVWSMFLAGELSLGF